MFETQPWMDRILNHFNRCVLWHSPGVIRFAVTPDGELVIAPAGVEHVGGPFDGGVVQPVFQLSLAEFIQIFADTPWVFWNVGEHSNITVQGTIDGEPAVVLVSEKPLPDDETDYRLYEDGTVNKP